MAIIKVQQGQSLTFDVHRVERDVPASNPRYGPSHKFVGATATDPDACVFMSPASAVRQLGRIGLTLDTVVGRTIEFAKPGEYVDINLPNGAVAPLALTQQPTTPPAPASNGKQAYSSGPHVPGLDAEPAPVATPSTADRLTALFALYDKCFDHASLTSKRLGAVGITTTHEGIAAQTATLFIAAKERGFAV